MCSAPRPNIEMHGATGFGGFEPHVPSCGVTVDWRRFQGAGYGIRFDRRLIETHSGTLNKIKVGLFFCKAVIKLKFSLAESAVAKYL